jgi:outer membrane protein assembly factor BamB
VRIPRVQVALVALLAAMALTGAWLRWRQRHASPAAVGATAPMLGEPAEASTRGLGAGPPPAVEASRGARMLHGDPRHTHRAAGHAPLETPVVVWVRDVVGPVEAQVVTSPDAQTLYVATLSGALIALDRADGAVKWTVALGDRAYATPAVADDGTVFAGSDAKKLVAVSPEGRVRWSLDTDGDADTGPAIAADGTIVFAAGRMVYGVSQLGFVKWRFAAKRKVFSAPAVAPGGRVFFGSQDHHAYALAPQGGVLWSTDLGADVDAGPVVGDDGAVFFGTDADQVVRLDPDDGHVAWRARLGGFVRGTLSLARSGDVLAGVYGPAPREVRLRATDGALLGDYRVQGTGAREFGVHGGALEDEGGALLFGTQDDAVVAIDDRGLLRWRFATGADVDAPVTLLIDGSVVFGSDDGKVYLLRGR